MIAYVKKKKTLKVTMAGQESNVRHLSAPLGSCCITFLVAVGDEQMHHTGTSALLTPVKQGWGI